MTTWFVSRHPGAVEWIKQSGVRIDVYCRHLSEAHFECGDVVIGTLPVHLAAQVCEQGASFYELVVDLPEELRGKELDKKTLLACNARLLPFSVSRVDPITKK